MLLLTSQSHIVASNPVTWWCDQELAQSFLNNPPPEQKKDGEVVDLRVAAPVGHIPHP